MRDVRVLFTSTPRWGHVHPMVPLARAFVAAGDVVVWATGPDGCASLKEEPFRSVPAGLSGADGEAEFARRFPEARTIPPKDRGAFTFPRLFGAVRAGPMADDLAATIATWKPDIVISEAAELAGALAAASADVPNVTHAFGAI